MSYSHLSIIERGQLETLHGLGWTAREIGQKLGRHHSTIARELKRGQRAERYEAGAAHDAYQGRRSSSAPLGKFSAGLATELQEKLEQTWSPEQIAEKRRNVLPLT
ncbi:helix-turn-helix domain-containing protein [Paenibacillus sp. J5C2022]|uniref:helix-turn-helix domain-containing protein n=1 Tax=Paenibacillus sp. J5C2022 TaxID=2977129 RepID=UPI0021D11D59|nr:helix-turn-helix domain-containing protein [Paenibacillus sp. J5C2022]